MSKRDHITQSRGGKMTVKTSGYHDGAEPLIVQKNHLIDWFTTNVKNNPLFSFYNTSLISTCDNMQLYL